VFNQKPALLAAYLMVTAVTSPEVHAFTSAEINFWECQVIVPEMTRGHAREINRCVASMIKLQKGHLDPVERTYLENSVDECPHAAFAEFATEPPSFIEVD